MLKRVADSIKPSMRPVRPLPRTWVLTGGLVLVCAAVALAGAARAGFYGVEKMGLLERVLIFSTLGFLAWVAGTEFVNEMIPGSRRRGCLRARCWEWQPGVSWRVCAAVPRLPYGPLRLRGYHLPDYWSAARDPGGVVEFVGAPSRLRGQFCICGTGGGHACGTGRRGICRNCIARISRLRTYWFGIRR